MAGLLAKLQAAIANGCPASKGHFHDITISVINLG